MAGAVCCSKWPGSTRLHGVLRCVRNLARHLAPIDRQTFTLFFLWKSCPIVRISITAYAVMAPHARARALRVSRNTPEMNVRSEREARRSRKSRAKWRNHIPRSVLVLGVSDRYLPTGRSRSDFRSLYTCLVFARNCDLIFNILWIKKVQENSQKKKKNNVTRRSDVYVRRDSLVQML